MSIKGYEVGYIIFGHLHIKNKKIGKILWKTITRIKVKLLLTSFKLQDAL